MVSLWIVQDYFLSFHELSPRPSCDIGFHVVIYIINLVDVHLCNMWQIAMTCGHSHIYFYLFYCLFSTDGNFNETHNMFIEKYCIMINMISYKYIMLHFYAYIV